MDVSEYRKQVTEELARAAEEGPAHKSVLRRAGKETDAGFRAAGSVLSSRADDVAALVEIIQDSQTEADLRTSALAAVGIEVGEHDDMFDMTLAILADPQQPVELRRQALNSLQAATFRVAAFAPHRPAYLSTLRALIDDRDLQLRRRSLEILAGEKDEYAQRRLLDGLEGRAKAPVGPTRAIQLLGYDIHAEHYPILRRIVDNPPSRAARIEAIQLLAADPSAEELLAGILADKNEHIDVRMAAARALQYMAPANFEGHARRMIMDEEEHDTLRTASLTALGHFADPATLDDDPELNEQAAQLHESAHSRKLKKASSTFLAGRSKA